MQVNINYQYKIKSRQKKTYVKYKKVSTNIWLIDLHIILMQLNTFLIGLKKNYLRFDQIIINKKEKESSFSAKSLKNKK